MLDCSKHSWTFPADTRLCTKNPVSTLTRWSIRPFRSHCEGFFATKKACFYSKKSYKGTTFGAKPLTPHESASHSRICAQLSDMVGIGSVDSPFAWRFGDVSNHIARRSPAEAVQESRPRWRRSPSLSLRLRQRRLHLGQPEGHSHSTVEINSRRECGTRLLRLS